MGLGLQHKNVNKIAAELGIAESQILGIFNKSVKKALKFFNADSSNGSEELKKVEATEKVNLNLTTIALSFQKMS